MQTRLPEQMQASCELERSHQTWNELPEAMGGPACDPRAPGSHITQGEFASAGGIFSTDLTRCSQGGLGAGRGPESLPHVEPQRGAAALWGRHSLTQILLPSPRSTEAPSTGDKMENPVTLTAPAETQSWEGREEEENPPPAGPRSLDSFFHWQETGSSQRPHPWNSGAQHLPRTKAEPEQDALPPPSSNTHWAPG